MSAASLLCCLTGSGPSARRPDSRGVAADATLQATRHANCRDIIVHPKFVKTLAFPPLEFCPMDWLPDEVITNVLTHVTGVDAARFAAVNRRARRLVADESLWRELFRRRFRFELPPAFEPPAEEGGWRGVYRHHQTTLDRIVRGEASDATRRFGGCDAFSRGFADAGRVGAVHVFHGGSLLVSS